MIYVDRKYLLMTSSRLERFKQVNEDLYNFRCPYCGDSHKNKIKARGYIYKIGNGYNFICHNCNVSTTFGKLLEYLDAEQYREYVLEKYVGEKEETPVFLNEGKKPMLMFVRYIDEFYHASIKELPDKHFAKEYIKNRLIPQKYWQEMVFTDNFKVWMDHNFPHHEKENLPKDPRIILFYTDLDGGITQVAGRALAAEEKLRYVTVKVSEGKKVFGLYRTNLGLKIYITEGQFDSLFLPNAVASGDANLNGLAEYLQKSFQCEDLVLVWDNTPRNRDVVRALDEAVTAGYKVVMLPYNEDSKDINEMIKNGLTKETMWTWLENNTYQGLEAKLKLKEWRRC